LRGRGRNRKPVCREDDERIDPPAATRAAVRMLTELVHLSGQRDVLLAIAAYNVGPRRIIQHIKRQHIDVEAQPVFWTLYERGVLHRQSSQLLVGVLAMTVIAQRRNDMALPPVAGPQIDSETAATPSTETSTAVEVSTSTQGETGTAVYAGTGDAAGTASGTDTGTATVEP